MKTIGSLCSGYGGLDQAAERVTGGQTVWHCENGKAPSRLLAHRFPGIPNHHDLKALGWAEHPVGVITGGYPCQPFSGAGKRMGTDDPRHLFPWIILGVERMRPTLLLLENVRGHVSLGFDVVLAALDRIGYDVRWTVLPASAIGAPHGRARLWIAARAREAGGWPAPPGQPTARVKDGVWLAPDDGLFGPESLAKAVNGSVPMWPAGSLVAGVAWETVPGGTATYALLKTPTAQLAVNGGSQHPDKRKGGHGPTLADEVEHLLPTPVSRDHKGDGQLGTASHAEALRRGQLEAVCTALLPTPRTSDTNGAGEHGAGGLDLRTAVSLLPTPRATDGTNGEPNQRGSKGDLMLPSAVVQLPPTPAVNDMGAGKTVEAWDAWTETQRVKHGNGNGHGPSLHIEAARMALLPTCDVVYAHTWGAYGPAIARWEALTRPAPAPTEPGRNGPRLSPLLPEWMLGLPAGWVTDVPGLSRNEQLALLGNGVVPQCAVAAYSLLGVSPALWQEAVA